MQMKERLLADLRKDEGFREYVYDDANGEPIVPGYTVKGHPTLWYGLCVEKGRMPFISGAIPLECLENSVTSIWHELVDAIPWIVDQDEKVQRALGNLAYNIGVAGVLKFQKMLRALLEDDRATAAAELLNSKYATQVPKRANRLAHLIAGTT